MAFDPKCYELSEHFLPSSASERLKDSLAQHIQDEIESWLESKKARIVDDMMRPAH